MREKKKQLVFAQWERGRLTTMFASVNCGLHTEYLNMEKCPFTY